MWINRAIADLELAEEKRLKKMRKLPLDNIIAIEFLHQIEEAAFVRAKALHTEDDYNFFISHYSSSLQLDSTIILRDEVAFITASTINTYQSYQDFFTKYPSALQAQKAKDKYEELLFFERTKDLKLKSFESFLEENPGTPFKDVIVKNIFEISTAGASETSFLNFIRKYSAEPYAKQARDILYHLRKENRVLNPLQGIANDSLRSAYALEKEQLFPFIWEKKYGFMNNTGEELIKPFLNELDRQYICGNIMDDFFVLDRWIIGRNKKVIYNGNFDDAEDIGYGFLLIQNRNCHLIIHKSGFTVVSDCIDDAFVVAGSFLAVKKKNWALFTFSGKPLTGFDFKEISSVENNITLHHTNNKFSIHTQAQIAALADREPLDTRSTFDEIRSWSTGLIWVRSGDREGMLTSQLRYTVPLQKQKLSGSRYGLISQSDAGYKFIEHEFLKTELYEKIFQGNSWLGLSKAGKWSLWHQQLDNFISGEYDSLSLLGTLPVLHRNDSAILVLANAQRLYISKDLNFKFLSSRDEEVYLLSEDRNRTYVHDGNNKRLFRQEFDRIDLLTKEVFIAERRGKKGLLNKEGKNVLAFEYDAFAVLPNGHISTLKDRKFGLFAPGLGLTIPAEYERNLQLYNSDILIAYQKGLFGFLNWKNKPLSGFEFEHIEYWNDSVAIVKQHFQWKLFDLNSRSFIMSNIKNYKLVRNDDVEKIAIINHDGGFGVISNKNGIIIPPTFSDIVNIGSAEEPFYFTEKHVEEAAYFVVVYYNKHGEVVKRQAFEAEEYDLIYCSKQ